MKIRIQGRPEFLLPLTLDEVNLAIRVSAKHYDHVCRDASLDGYYNDGRNFLTSWQRTLENYAKHPPTEEDYASGFVVSISATWRQLDTTLKILEPCNLFMLEDVEKMVAGRLSRDLREALREANYLCAGWAATVDTEANLIANKK